MHATDRSRDRRPLVIGLTGGIASGKTTAADLFAGHGVPVLDTDVIAREVVAPGTQGLQKVRAAFGDAILEPDGSLNRAALRQRIFEDPDARRQLEAIVHPLVFDALDRGLRTAGGPYQIHVIPLLVETGLQNRIDRVLVIDCVREVQLARLLARDADGREQAERILDAQVDRETRLAAADDVLDNAGPAERLGPLVARLHEFYLTLARSSDRAAPGIRLP